jgi:O-antigen biosynthesis protein
MTRPKLLVFSHDYTLTGAPIALFNALIGLKSTFEILVLSQTDGPLRTALMDAGIRAEAVPNVLADSKVSARVMESQDIVICNTLLTCVPIHAAHQLGKPSLWYIHEGHWGPNFFMERYKPAMPGAFPLVSRVAVPCQFARDLYASRLADKPVDIVPYGVPNQERPPPPAKVENIHVLQLGSFEARKGQDLALSAFRGLNDDRFLLHFVGNIQDPNYRQQVVSHFADVRQVRYWDSIPKEQTAAIIVDCDMLIVPSRDEVTPMVILEAMALGKPVIAARICGIPEMIEEGKTGFLFEKDNVDQLRNLIVRLGRDPDLRRQVGNQGREFQRQHRTLEQCSARFDKILHELLDGARVLVGDKSQE